jgi:hypothetical protein
MNIQVGDLIQDKMNTYQIQGFEFDNYAKLKSVVVRCIRGPNIGKVREVMLSTMKKMYVGGQLLLVGSPVETI